MKKIFAKKIEKILLNFRNWNLVSNAVCFIFKIKCKINYCAEKQDF